MTRFEEALVTVARTLERGAIPYMVVGGVANLFWGVPRTTLDLDVTVWIEEADIPPIVRRLGDVFRLLPEDPLGFVRETRVLPMQTKQGFRTDLIFGALPFEHTAIQRARPMTVAGQAVRICSPEDLIIYKIVSDRPRDREDVAGIIRTQMAKLDRHYLDPLVEGLATDMGRPDLLDFYRRCLGEED